MKWWWWWWRRGLCQQTILCHLFWHSAPPTLCTLRWHHDMMMVNGEELLQLLECRECRASEVVDPFFFVLPAAPCTSRQRTFSRSTHDDTNTTRAVFGKHICDTLITSTFMELPIGTTLRALTCVVRGVTGWEEEEMHPPAADLLMKRQQWSNRRRRRLW